MKTAQLNQTCIACDYAHIGETINYLRFSVIIILIFYQVKK